MGTKETYDELLQMFYRDAECYSSELSMTKRRVELINVLKNLGLFCFYHDYYHEPAVTYRGHTFVFDIVEPFQLGFYADIATFDCLYHKGNMSKLFRLYFSSPRWTWKHLCGRAGTMTICVSCPKQVDFSLEIMN